MDGSWASDSRPPGEAEAYAALEARVGEIDMRRCDGCSRCHERCTDGLEITYPEFARLMESLARLPVERVARVLAQEKSIAGWEETGIQLCPFLDRETESCLVYSARFLICRLFGHAAWLPCPYDTTEPLADAVAILQAYADLERHTAHDWLRLIGARVPWLPTGDL